MAHRLSGTVEGILARMSMDPLLGLSTWLEVDLRAIASNLRQLKEIARTEVMAVVKANGYGHGMVEVARRALKAGALFCGVARIDEALQLRKAGLAAPVLVLGDTPRSRLREAVEAGISLTLFAPSHLSWLSQAAGLVGREARVHVKVDTGMSRLGVPAGEAFSILRQAQAQAGVRVEGLYTHFARADESGAQANVSQLNLFHTLIDEVKAHGIRPRYLHAANSAAALSLPESRLDMVRPGIALYGLHPSHDVLLPPGFRRAISWKARLSQTRMLISGGGVSYGHEYVADHDHPIGVVPVGYGDGYRRVAGNSVLVMGKRVPVLGRVCMDQIMVDLSSVPEASPGDEVVLLGEQAGAVISAEELAELWGTINYEVVCGLSARVPRLYQGPPPEKSVA